MRVCRVTRRHTRDPWSFCRRAPSAASRERSGEQGPRTGSRPAHAWGARSLSPVDSSPIEPLPLSKGQVSSHHTPSGGRWRGRSRLGAREPVEDMSLERMAGGSRGWSKSSAGSWVMPRRSMTLRERKFAGTVNETISCSPSARIRPRRRPRPLRSHIRVPSTPAPAASPPRPRSEMRLERRRREADEADEGGDARDLHGPETEAVGVEMRLDPVDDRRPTRDGRRSTGRTP